MQLHSSKPGSQNMAGKERVLLEGHYIMWGGNLPPGGEEQRCHSSAFHAASVSEQLSFKPVLCWLGQIGLLTCTLKWCRRSTEISVSLPSAYSLSSMGQAVLPQSLNVFLTSPDLKGDNYMQLQWRYCYKEKKYSFQLKLVVQRWSFFLENGEGNGIWLEIVTWMFQLDVESTIYWCREKHWWLSGHVLSLWYKAIGLEQQFKDLLHYFGYLSIALNVMVTTNQCNVKAGGLIVFENNWVSCRGCILCWYKTWQFCQSPL